jgi:TatD DNase family protein
MIRAKECSHTMLIDSHAHLDMPEYAADLPEVLLRARGNGVQQIVTVGIDFASSNRALALARKHSFLFATVGCHPHHADALAPEDLDRLAALTLDPNVVAWGEIGLDYYRNRASRKGQLRAFENQLEKAAHLDLPVVIHDRDAHEDVVACIRAMGARRPSGVIHCFSGDYALARVFLDLGFYLSIPGTVTFPKAEITREVAVRIPLDRLLVETDAPFLTPVPFRGKRNEPARVVHTAQEISRLRGLDFEEVACQTAENTRRVFGLPQPDSTEAAGQGRTDP